MKITHKFGISIFLCCVALVLTYSCNDKVRGSEPVDNGSSAIENSTDLNNKIPISSDFKSYWYAGEAELSSFELEQVRYGEIRKGNAVQVFVTEPFLPEKQVKADYDRPGNIPVLKMNTTKKFLTGIYPYSIMTSAFLPVNQSGHALKVSNSVQEWCGQVYTQLNNRDSFEVISHSYFESEGDQNLKLEKTVLEDELWSIIRIRPETLPTGSFEAIPALEYLRLSHNEIKAYQATANQSTSEGVINYTLNYPQLGRTLVITFGKDFPHQIEGWTESTTRGSGESSTTLTSKARRIKSIKTAYWRKNRNSDQILRDSLGLPL